MKEIIINILLKRTHFTKEHCEDIADEIINASLNCNLNRVSQAKSKQESK